jgi:hypothetical protein
MVHNVDIIKSDNKYWCIKNFNLLY